MNWRQPDVQRREDLPAFPKRKDNDLLRKAEEYLDTPHYSLCQAMAALCVIGLVLWVVIVVPGIIP